MRQQDKVQELLVQNCYAADDVDDSWNEFVVVVVAADTKDARQLQLQLQLLQLMKLKKKKKKKKEDVQYLMMMNNWGDAHHHFHGY
jgi:hypothetical protein